MMKMDSKVMAGAFAALLVASAATASAAAPPGAGAYFDAGPAQGSAAGLRMEAQYYWRHRQWCWYFDGWRGPGYYWCGYAFRRGLGWGGPMGWRGWTWRKGGPGDFHDDRRGFRGEPGDRRDRGPGAFHRGERFEGERRDHGGERRPY